MSVKTEEKETRVKLRQRSVRMLIAKHREEFETRKTRIATSSAVADMSVDTRRYFARNEAQKQLVDAHYAEFLSYLEDQKLLHTGENVYTKYYNKIDQEVSRNREESYIRKLMAGWCTVQAHRELRIGHKQEYRALVEEGRKLLHYSSTNTLYYYANTRLSDKHKREFDTHYMALKLQLDEYLVAKIGERDGGSQVSGE